MFKNVKEISPYLVSSYEDITDARLDDNHFDVQCETCNIVRGFQVVRKYYSVVEGPYDSNGDPIPLPNIIVLRCPVCFSFKIWIVYTHHVERKTKGGVARIDKYYRITSIPGAGMEDLNVLPEKPVSLREAYRQAVRSMDANAHLAAAAMFRRALQIITRELLGVKPGNLAIELKDIVGLKYNGITITNDFQKVGYVIKEAGNQGAHPDKDPDLLSGLINI